MPEARRNAVLLVGGTTLARLSYGAVLEGAGCSAEESGTDREALSRAHGTLYDAVLLELRLRYMSGLALVEALRSLLA